MKTKKATRAKSAKANAKKQIENVVSVETVESVESVESVNTTDVVATKTGTESGKVSSKDVLKAAGSIRATVKEERRGANCTIRLIAERAAAGDANAVNILCALCDVPRNALFTLNIATVRAAVNAYYPYYVETDGRKISVKPVGVWYSTQKDGEAIEDASKRVKRGYMVIAVVDYLDMLIKAAKSRAKGITPRCVDADTVYNDIAMSDASEDIFASEIDEAKERKTYLPGAANVWHKDRNGFYI